jgi:hypothetical protein
MDKTGYQNIHRGKKKEECREMKKVYMEFGKH